MADFKRDRVGEPFWVVVSESVETVEDKSFAGTRRRKCKVITAKEEWLHVRLSCGHVVKEDAKPQARPICMKCQFGDDDAT